MLKKLVTMVRNCHFVDLNVITIVMSGADRTTKVALTWNIIIIQYYWITYDHRIINDRIENYGANIVFISIPYPYTYWGGLWVRQRVKVGGRGGELVNLPSAKEFWRTLRAKADCA